MPKEISKCPRRRDGERIARPRWRHRFPAFRRKTLFGETPNTTREDAYAPRIPWRRAFELEVSCGSTSCLRWKDDHWSFVPDALPRAIEAEGLP